ncbi:cytochrome c-type biogenesis protein [Halobacillus karajensis]|uniref:Thiol:disulfide interchange protein n=1 Tax=Halobacillus karajensis TaxID=195088 RepID=A0A024P6A9_9BACI|nr:cytochrome c biogenesis protein CcdA [Halobacillus karajensis]CDQ20638.1 Thiol:disulfide interchange protein [Halobacillus karajensis]CDQ23892.1 Thiol:disulfide interchange protein [Halobacillus karajensis]CDQ27370.1 Thiol:disulfide interchange protein [Halobacillus karajensis]SEH88287.1 cytochrome c-type biogenesis protein [Halobacillus karajensis]
MGSDVTVWLAFGAGIISFLSPCTLPLFPAYLSYITGMSVKEIKEDRRLKVKRRVLVHSVLFLLGVSSIFLGLGVGASYLGNTLQRFLAGETGVLLQRMAGVFIILMGLFVAGWLKIEWLMKTRRINRKPKSSLSSLGTFFAGVGFAAGWTPCIGPVFASILLLAASNPAQGTLYTIVYVIGFALPFLVFSFFIGSTRAILKYSDRILKIGGVAMVIVGVFLYTGYMTRISTMLLNLVQDTWLSNLGVLL